MSGRSLIALGVLALAILAADGVAENLGRGTYHGYATTDRWGQHVFHTGAYHLFMTDEVAKSLAKYDGKPLALKVSEIWQDGNFGTGMIRGVEKVSVKGANVGLVLSAKPASTRVEQRRGLWLRLSVRNDSKQEIIAWPGGFRVVLVTDSPFSNQAIGYRDGEGRAYWHHHAVYDPRDAGRGRLEVACREIVFAWSAQRLIARGSGVKPGPHNQIAVAPGGGFEVSAAVGKELLPGKYEAFFCLGTGNFSYPAGPMSKRVSFDVVPAKR